MCEICEWDEGGAEKVNMPWRAEPLVFLPGATKRDKRLLQERWIQWQKERNASGKVE